jgi:hypothetical protein
LVKSIRKIRKALSNRSNWLTYTKNSKKDRAKESRTFSEDMTEGMKGRGFSYEKDSKRLSFSSFFLVATDGLKDAAGFPKR